MSSVWNCCGLIVLSALGEPVASSDRLPRQLHMLAMVLNAFRWTCRTDRHGTRTSRLRTELRDLESRLTAPDLQAGTVTGGWNGIRTERSLPPPPLPRIFSPAIYRARILLASDLLDHSPCGYLRTYAARKPSRAARYGRPSSTATAVTGNKSIRQGDWRIVRTSGLYPQFPGRNSNSEADPSRSDCSGNPLLSSPIDMTMHVMFCEPVGASGAYSWA